MVLMLGTERTRRVHIQKKASLLNIPCVIIKDALLAISQNETMMCNHAFLKKILSSLENETESSSGILVRANDFPFIKSPSHIARATVGIREAPEIIAIMMLRIFFVTRSRYTIMIEIVAKTK